MADDDDLDEEAARADDPSIEVPSAVDPGKNVRIRNKAKREQAEAVAFWSAVFADRMGRLEMWKILEASSNGGWRSTPFALGPTGFPQPEATWYNAGEREFALRLYHSWLRMVPEGVLLMLRENDDRFIEPKPKPKAKRDG